MFLTLETYNTGTIPNLCSFTDFTITGDGIKNYKVISQPVENNLFNTLVECEFNENSEFTITITANSNFLSTYIYDVFTALAY